MKILISYVIQGGKRHQYNSEIVEIKLDPPLYSPEPCKSDVDIEIVKWLEQRQSCLSEGKKLVVLKTLRSQ